MTPDEEIAQIDAELAALDGGPSDELAQLDAELATLGGGEVRVPSAKDFGGDVPGGVLGYPSLGAIGSTLAAREFSPVENFIGQTAAEAAPALVPQLRAAKWAMPALEAGSGTLYDYLTGNIQGEDVPGELLTRIPTYYGLSKVGEGLGKVVGAVAGKAEKLGDKAVDVALGTNTKRWTQAYKDAIHGTALPEDISSEILTDLTNRNALLKNDLFYSRVNDLDEAFNLSRIRVNSLTEEMDGLVRKIDEKLAPMRDAVMENGVNVVKEVPTPRADTLISKMAKSDVAGRRNLSAKLNEAKQALGGFDNSFQAFLDEKRELYRRVNWNATDLSDRDANALWMALSLDIKDNAERIAEKTLSPEDFAKFKEINQTLGAYLDLQEGLPKMLGKDSAQSLFQANTPLTALANVSLATGTGAAVGGLLGGRGGAMVGAGLGFAASTPRGQITAGKAMSKYGKQIAESSALTSSHPILLSMAGQTVSALAANVTGVRDANADTLPAELAQDKNFLGLQLQMKRVPEAEGLQMLSSYMKGNPGVRDYFDPGPLPGYTTVQGGDNKWYLYDPHEKASYAEYVRRSEPDVVMLSKKLKALNDRNEVIIGGTVEKPRLGEAQEIKTTKTADGKRQEYDY